MRKLIMLVLWLGWNSILTAETNKNPFIGSWFSPVTHDAKLFDADVFRRLIVYDSMIVEFAVLGIKGEKGKPTAYVIMVAVGKLSLLGEGKGECNFDKEGFKFEIQKDGAEILTNDGSQNGTERMFPANKAPWSQITIIEGPLVPH